MPLLEINQIRHICASVRLDEATAAQVDQYAAFIRASADDVVDKALNYVFSKDRDFQEFLKDSAGEAGRFDFACPESHKQWCSIAARKEDCSRRGIYVFGARGEGMMNPSISWQCRNGASQRCFAPEEFLTLHPWKGTGEELSFLVANCPNSRSL